MFTSLNKAKMCQAAAWYGFIAPLAGVGFFLIWNHGDVLDWVSAEFLTPLLFAAFYSGFVSALVPQFTRRGIVSRPVKEIAVVGAAMSALLVGMLTVFLKYSH